MCSMLEKPAKAIPYVKGQVWLVREPAEVTEAKMKTGTHLMLKTRPYLIYMSEESAQMKFTIVQGFPISSNPKMDSTDRTFYDFDVRFQNPKGEINRVITGQLTSIDVRYIDKYICSLPTSVMDEIDGIISKRFGLINENNPIMFDDDRIIRWSPSKANLFLAESNIYSSEWVSKKWGIPEDKLARRRSYCRKYLRVHAIS